MDVPRIGEDGIYHWNSTQVVKVESPYTHDLIEITLSRNIDEERRVQQETLEKNGRQSFCWRMHLRRRRRRIRQRATSFPA